MNPLQMPDAELHSFDLENAEERARRFPDSFEIPDRKDREALQPGDHARVLMRFMLDEPEEPEATERIWIVVTERIEQDYMGLVANCPACIEENDELWLGSEIPFRAEHVIDILPATDDSRAFANERPLSRWPR